MAELYHLETDGLAVDPVWLDRLKAAAREAPRRRSRLVLHRALTDPVQEMLLALCADGVIPPHRHPGRNESFYVVEGQLTLLLFGPTGDLEDAVRLGPPGGPRPFATRVPGDRWHTVVVETPIAVVWEVGQGPYGGPPQPPEWCPNEPGALAQFLTTAMARLRL